MRYLPLRDVIKYILFDYLGYKRIDIVDYIEQYYIFH